jgi:hypothetical protein
MTKETRLDDTLRFQVCYNITTKFDDDCSPPMICCDVCDDGRWKERIVTSQFWQKEDLVSRPLRPTTWWDVSRQGLSDDVKDIALKK